MTYRIVLLFAFCATAFSAFAQTPARDPANEVEVAVPARDIARGAKIAESDLTYQAVPALRANSSIIRAISDAAGRESRRALKAGEMIRISDLKRPTLVAKGSTVTMLFEAPGIKLTGVGRALVEGGEGETITVLNPASYRQVEAIVVGPGTVRVGAGLAASSELAASQQ
jgi:flagella basal body P-ring formation protein FlgA